MTCSRCNHELQQYRIDCPVCVVVANEIPKHNKRISVLIGGAMAGGLRYFLPADNIDYRAAALPGRFEGSH